MKTVIQRVDNASVMVDGATVGAIDAGLLVYLGVERRDTERDIDYLVKKIPRLRLFQDEDGKINRSVVDAGLSILVVSQFTLCANLKKGNRPSFDPAAEPGKAEAYYDKFVEQLRNESVPVATGVFGAHMHVSYTNDGPVTILLDSPENQVESKP
ncbi:MAG: D-tyrosyl-tRNA(Tyr) deacylase [Spirochaetales bacterium]|nr:D-aminoacyl-tRNA deacylase [Sphaerochaetaceae bacterium]NLV84309.1 D-tyrosyl-tRNA(Tyr) deacylase [Spirochaetales bacterium]